MSNRSEQHPPFVQIQGSDRTTVFGLTTSGEVWRWFYDGSGWEQIGEVVEASRYIPDPILRGP